MSTVLNVVLRRVNIPTVIGYIVTGTVLAALFKLDESAGHTLESIAEFGIVFLMFTIGLEFSFTHLSSMRREVFVFGFLQVVLTAVAMGLGANLFFGVPPVSAAIVGSGLALSSTAIVLKILNESGKIKSDEGRSAVGILIFQDIAVIPILLMISLATEKDAKILPLIGEMAVNAVILIGVIYLAGRYLLKSVFRVVSETNSREIYIGSILLTAVGASYLAHYFGFSYSLGGFLAGMMIADTIYKYQVEADLIPFRDLLLGVFFISVGLQIDFRVVWEFLPVILGLCLGLMLVKGIIIHLLLLTSHSSIVAFKTAVNLSQIGEFALVVLSLMLGNRLMPADQVQILMVTVVVSMIATPFLINNADAVMRLLFRRSEQADHASQLSMISGHVVLLGFGNLGQIISRQLEQADIQHVVVTQATDEYVKARELGKMAVFGDPSDRVVLRQVGIGQAMSTIIAVDDIETVRRTSAAITLVDPSISVIARVSSEDERSEIEGFDHELVLDGNSSTAQMIVDQIQRSRRLTQETSEIRYVKDIDTANTDDAITMVVEEQKRLLGLASKSFNGIRNREDVMQIKAYHESFEALSEIIGRATRGIVASPNLSAVQYERINTVIDNHDRLVAMNSVLETLGRELYSLARDDKTRSLAETAVEGLDSILLTLIALSAEYSDFEMQLLDKMTSSQAKGFAGVRERYLAAERDLDVDKKAMLLAATNHMDRLRVLFGEVGNNYRKLADYVQGDAGLTQPVGV
ncbi:MAG: cation:proton antiporter [Novosphingobium sp.]|nr:cation:proton antiporter [Novosphingobium sp.]